MKEFFYDMFIEPFSDRDALGYFIGAFMWLFLVAIVAGLIWLSVWLIDSSFLPIKKDEGVVIDKYIIPEHTTTTYVMSGKSMIPMTNHYPESYEITINIKGLTDEVSLRYCDWSQINLGQRVPCDYTNGRLLKSLYIKNIYN